MNDEPARWDRVKELFQAALEQPPEKRLPFLREACGRIGIDDQKVKEAIQTRSVWARIERHTKEAHDIGITSVPATYLDGRKMDAWALAKFWDYVFSFDPKPTSAPATRP